VIERSFNGVDYDEAGMLMTGNNSENKKNYSYTDRLSGKERVVYYRLKGVDLDGTMKYSEIRGVTLSINQAEALEITAYPNPVINDLAISIQSNGRIKDRGHGI
jgi:hypothetical protein